ncbi:MAG: hypothetical protein V8T86_14650 [Victivallis sp.]
MCETSNELWLNLLREAEDRNGELRTQIARLRKKILEEMREGTEETLYTYLQEAETVTAELEEVSRELLALDHQLIGLHNEIAVAQEKETIETEIDPDDFTLDLNTGHDNQWCWCLNNQAALATMEVNRLCSIDMNLGRIRELLGLEDEE